RVQGKKATWHKSIYPAGKSGNRADDPHYTLIADPSGLGDATVADDAFPIPPWFANNAGSRWIGPDDGNDAVGPNGVYDYETRFFIPPWVDLDTFRINGSWGMDDGSPDILINGQALGLGAAGFTGLSPFIINTGFVRGQNSLVFRLSNNGGPTGLRVDNLVGSWDAQSYQVDLGVLPAWASTSMTLVVHFPSNTPLQVVTNAAVVTTTSPEQVLTNNAATVATEIGVRIDLDLDKTVSVVDSNLTYTIVITNRSTSDAHQVMVADTVPPALTVLSADPVPFLVSTQGIILDLFNTGVDDNGVALAGGSPSAKVEDPHYRLLRVGGIDVAPFNAFLAEDDDWPITPGIWLQNDADARWIDSTGAENSVDLVGDYIYRTTFSLPECADLSTVQIGGEWSSDNAGLDILINGLSSGNANPIQFGGASPFLINAGFVAGLNTLDFVMNNAGGVPGPTGLRVDNLIGVYDANVYLFDLGTLPAHSST
ncbi:MAG: hypothetical protein AAF492_22475, partial [Verrucomicrobiota bacterium]